MVSFNPALLLRGLELFQSERVTVSQKTQMGPILVAGQDDHVVCVTMPLKPH
jgi:DNA polymerase III sliding clamp (beta) subunit (PCNA family)